MIKTINKYILWPMGFFIGRNVPVEERAITHVKRMNKKYRKEIAQLKGKVPKNIRSELNRYKNLYEQAKDGQAKFKEADRKLRTTRLMLADKLGIDNDAKTVDQIVTKYVMDKYRKED